MQKFLITSTIFLFSLISPLCRSNIAIKSSANHHQHSDKSAGLKFGYQYGYSEIRSKNNHMSDDSGAFLGIHLMKPIESTLLKSDIYLAAGAHATFTADRHIGIMLGMMFPINESTMISLMPGIVFMEHDASHSNSNMSMNHMVNANKKWQTEEAIHIEISHTINLFNRILNPSISCMASPNHNQFSLGLNFHF